MGKLFKIIKRAMLACENSGHDVSCDFPEVRKIVEAGATTKAVAEFLYESKLDSRQIYFVNQIVEYIVHNGLMKDRSIMQDTPFTDKGNIVELCGEDMRIWGKIVKAIDAVNENAIAI